MSDIPNKHLMIDIETMGAQPGCAVTAIGAVWFDPEDNGWRARHRGYYAEVLLSHALKYGTATPEAIKFWMKQDDSAREHLTTDEGKVTLERALQGLDAFIWHQAQEADRKDVHVWGKCNKFDLGNLEAMYQTLGLPIPWHPKRGENVRTVVWLAEQFFNSTTPEMKPGRTAHNALDDAIHQAEYVTEMVRKIRGVTPDDTGTA